MKNLGFISIFALFISCNKNKTNHSEGSEAMSIDSSSSVSASSSSSDSMRNNNVDSAAIHDASQSGASSITPKQDSVRQR